MRTKTRLLGALVVLGTAGIVACVGFGLSSSTQKNVVVAPTQNPYDFGTVAIGMLTTSADIVVGPESMSDDDTITSVTIDPCSDFALVTPLNLPAHVFNQCGSGTGSGPLVGGTGYGSGACFPFNYRFKATFTPNGPTPSSCNVHLNFTRFDSTTGTYNVMLKGTGMAPLFGLALTPAITHFFDVPISSTSTGQIIRLENTGTMAVTVTLGQTDPTRFPITGANLAPHVLTPGSMAAELYTVKCSPGPADTTPFTGSLAVTTPPSDGGQSKTVTFDCRGISSPLTIDPSPADFATTLVGNPPGDVNITITNSSGATVASVNAVLDPVGLDPGLTLVSVTPAVPRMLLNGQNVVAKLHYAAGSEMARNQLGSLKVSATGFPDRSVGITGEALVGQIGTSPAEVDFGPVCAGGTSSRDVVVYAAASGAVQLASVTPPALPFTITPASARLTENHGTGVTLSAKVMPTLEGAVESSFTLNSNAPADPAHVVKMKATALLAGVAATPDVVHFGPTKVRTPAIRELVLSNCETSDIMITGAHMEGANASEFTITDPSDPTSTLVKMGSAKFQLAMTPQTNGPKAAMLVVEYGNGMTATAALDGNGFGGDDSGKRRETYYACSTGTPGSLWPIAVAVAALGAPRRRRRRRTA